MGENSIVNIACHVQQNVIFKSAIQTVLDKLFLEVETRVIPTTGRG